MRGIKKPVRVYRIITQEIYVGQYPSIADAANALNVQATSVRRVLIGERNKAGEYTFRHL